MNTTGLTSDFKLPIHNKAPGATWGCDRVYLLLQYKLLHLCRIEMGRIVSCDIIGYSGRLQGRTLEPCFQNFNHARVF
jgi:hypothetical protein